MTLSEFLDDRDNLLKKVCYRAYVCGNDIKMIIVNIRSGTTAFLDDISAEFFDILANQPEVSIEGFLSENEIMEEEMEAFIEELFNRGVIGKKYDAQDVSTQGSLQEQHESLKEFESLLCKNGYLYNLHIDVTDSCNLKCEHCYHPFDSCYDKDILSLDEIKTIIDNAYSLGAFNVTISGGEAFLRKDLWEIIDYITNKRMTISLLTNGTLVTETDVENINKYNIKEIRVSLYSILEEVHDSITTIHGSCKKTKDNLQRLEKTDPLVKVNCVLMRKNFSQYKQLSDYCEEHGFSLILDTSITPKLNGNKEPMALSLDYEQIVAFSMDKNYNYYIGNNKELDWDEHPCSAGQDSIYCSASGNIYPCVSLRLFLGDAKDIVNIWNGSKLLLEWRRVRLKDFSACGKEDYCKYCFEVCAGICLLENGNYLESSTSNCLKAKARHDAYKKYANDFK